MDFIERLFGISPDGGSGATELILFLAGAAIVFCIVFRRSVIKLVRRRAGQL
jgi:hypothetical protein